MFKSILLPTDGTEFCERAISHGVALAKCLGAKVVGLTVTPALRPGTHDSMLPTNLLEAAEARAATAAAERLAGVDATAAAVGVAVETATVAHDHPWEAIVATAEAKGCDLIVMASHGRKGLSGLILGSETQKVLMHSKIPVIVIRQ